ncbi:Bug family tripartite tricarboxylate transporter substrate binding protein [Rhodoplanes sp. Z2-YC6860]|uniref:Bug family tripartite tricarboxylate transporter substrate binding protein n=1 Tax=Rhodoplanes sp. Z2-YC6860 TaxID=674703 RepID=UPI000A8217C6|nr:tripartite tricarboxylate transporter substrate binding protein [Rhodoplanes sp. Z2-YC6860]
MSTRRSMVLLGLALVAGLSRASAAEFPERPITVIIPYAAGGAGDTITRLLSPVIERELGQPLVIDNRPGGGGMIGAQAVAKAAPDGHTLMVGAANNFVINQFLFPKVSFDPLTAFTLITKIADVPSVLYASLSAPSTLAEFIARAKANPGKLSYASPSVGTTPHLAVERLKQLTGIDLVHVPYRGAPPAMQALMADEVQLYLAGWGVGKAQVEARRVQALAVASRERVPSVPLPTAIESGVPDYVASNWWGLAAPRGTPQPVIDRIHRAALAALADPTIRQRLDDLAFVPAGDAPQKFLDDCKAEAKVWGETISRGKLAIE